ncbi:MAG: hypothetical protein Q3983_06505 [Capnocytophaga sp.]|nr:hypothetical protein [Capnocytophaga sp.]
MNIDISKKGIRIDNNLLTELSENYIKELLGEPRIAKINEEDIPYKAMYIWDYLGIYAFVSKNGNISTIACRVQEDTEWENTVSFDYFAFRPKEIFNGNITINGKNITDYISNKYCKDSFSVDISLQEWSVSAMYKKSLIKELKVIDKKEIASCVIKYAFPFRDYEFNYKPKRVSSGKWEIPKIGEECLSFTDFNFKLAIMQELMYNQEVLQPKFDVYDFCEDYSKREIDPEDYYERMIPEVKRWFNEYPIPVSFASLVTELYFDGGNEIYSQLIPSWDGESSIFNIKEITEEEIRQFPNWKVIQGTSILMAKKAKGICKQEGITIIE